MRVGSGIQCASSVHRHKWLQDHHCSDVKVIHYHQKAGNNKLCKRNPSVVNVVSGAVARSNPSDEFEELTFLF